MIIATKWRALPSPNSASIHPGFGGIPRLKRDLAMLSSRFALYRTNRQRNTRASRRLVAPAYRRRQSPSNRPLDCCAKITKYDAVTRAAAKKFIKPIPHEELRREIDLFCELFTRPAVMAALKKFVEDSGPMPYLP